MVSLVTLSLIAVPQRAVASSGGPEDGYGDHGGGQSCSTIHQIAAGENLTAIAASYGVSLEALIEENGISDANIIVIGQSLCIPEHDGGGPNGYDREGYDREGYDRGGYDPGGARPNGDDSYGNGPSDDGWSAYGVPGQSYDPAWDESQDSHGPDRAYGPQENDYDYDSWHQPYMVPGKSYDPSYYSQQNNNDSQGGYGPQDGYGSQDSYGPQDGNRERNSYGPQDGYGPQEYGNGQENWDREESWNSDNYGVPGKSYDPYANPQATPMPMRRGQGQDFFPEYFPSTDEEETATPTPTDDTIPPDTDVNP